MNDELSFREQYIMNQIRYLLPKKSRLRMSYIVDTDLIDQCNDDSEYWNEYAKRYIGKQIGDLILNDKPDTFSTRFDYDMNTVHQADLIVMSPQEFAKYQSDLLRFIKTVV